MKKNKISLTTRPVFTSPGTLKYVGKVRDENLEIKQICFSNALLESNIVQDISKLEIKVGLNNWIDVNGVHKEAEIEKLCNKFNIHGLMAEDLLNTLQKPKLEVFSDQNAILTILKVPKVYENQILLEHVAVVLMPNLVLTFQEKDSFNVFDTVLERLQRENSKTRKNGLDYLFYVIIDLIIDHFFLCLDDLTDKIEILSDKVILENYKNLQNEIYFTKKEVLVLKKTIGPIKEVLMGLLRDDEELFSKDTLLYLKDAYSHVKEVLETTENLKEEIDYLTNNYHAQTANKMNQVMKTFTVFTAIFMPLTFIVGIYGMNFKVMPELEDPNGYYYVLAGMGILSVGLWIYFKVKKYI